MVETSLDRFWEHGKVIRVELRKTMIDYFRFKLIEMRGYFQLGIQNRAHFYQFLFKSIIKL